MASIRKWARVRSAVARCGQSRHPDWRAAQRSLGFEFNGMPRRDTRRTKERTKERNKERTKERTKRANQEGEPRGRTKRGEAPGRTFGSSTRLGLLFDVVLFLSVSILLLSVSKVFPPSRRS